ncbi:hypothetical protein L208DRAFT_1408206 [Tricholoma matsutake]|nr:hypothetical protein L208DRAFT_1408206 [Tricholoma matsutake 945]
MSGYETCWVGQAKSGCMRRWTGMQGTVYGMRQAIRTCTTLIMSSGFVASYFLFLRPPYISVTVYPIRLNYVEQHGPQGISNVYEAIMREDMKTYCSPLLKTLDDVVPEKPSQLVRAFAPRYLICHNSKSN